MDNYRKNKQNIFGFRIAMGGGGHPGRPKALAGSQRPGPPWRGGANTWKDYLMVMVTFRENTGGLWGIWS